MLIKQIRIESIPILRTENFSPFIWSSSVVQNLQIFRLFQAFGENSLLYSPQPNADHWLVTNANQMLTNAGQR